MCTVPTFPYKDIHGNLCDDVHSVSISVLSYQEEYSIALRNPNDTLFLYLESHSFPESESVFIPAGDCAFLR